MENSEEFEACLSRLLLDVKRKLGISDKMIAYILLREGTAYYFKCIAQEELP